MAPQREWFEKDYYKILGVGEKVNAKELTRAYRKLARENHPDSKPDDPAAEERFKEISVAYDVIGDAEKRKEYDKVRASGPMGGFSGRGAPSSGPGGGFGGPGGFSFNVDDIGGMGGGIGDVLGNLFGGGGGGSRGRGGRRGATGAQRGGDLEASLHLDFVDAVNGITTALHLISDAVCHTCTGSGAEPGTSPTPCPTCGGRGIVQDDQGMFAMSRPCPTCSGRGAIIEHPCSTCRGTGVERRPREVKVRIPAGVKDGQRIRLQGRGDPGRNGGPPGDLFVVCSVEPHPLFRMEARNLRLTVPVTFPEAVLGSDIEVPTLDGATVKVRIPAGTRPGRTFRVKGRGVPAKKGAGDLLVTVEVAVPKSLDEAAGAALGVYADAERSSGFDPRARWAGAR